MEENRFRIRGPGLAEKYRRNCVFFCTLVLVVTIPVAEAIRWVFSNSRNMQTIHNYVPASICLLIPAAFIITDRKIRALKGRCWNCGYSRTGLHSYECCPECGKGPNPPR